MLGPADETVGLQFSVDRLQEARDKTLQVIERAAAQIAPGWSENQARALLEQLQAEVGCERTWHAPQVRFGPNSVLGFGRKGVENSTLQASDIYFLDLGLVFDGHEGDVGRSYIVGENAEMKRCSLDVAQIWAAVRERWQTSGATGPELYRFAKEITEAKGWKLSLEKANGHRIADFPHAAKARGSIENFELKPMPNRWILEIQIRHPQEDWGAFYEDLLA